MSYGKKNPIETLNESHALRTSYVCDFFFYFHFIRSFVYSFCLSLSHSSIKCASAIEKVVAAVVWYLLLV